MGSAHPPKNRDLGRQHPRRGLPSLVAGWFLLAALLFGGATSGRAALRPPPDPPEYHLTVSFDLSRGKILGQAAILAPPGSRLIIDPGELNLIRLEHDGENLLSKRWAPGREIVVSPRGPVRIIYETDTDRTDNNIVRPGEILLTGMWYPTVEGFCRFRLTAVLPPGYQAVSEAERVTVTQTNGQVEFAFDFPFPLHDRDGINLAASDRYVVSRATWNEVELLTYFFPEEAHLAARHLERTKQALAVYERLLGPYPYRRLALVENLQGVTQAMPTFILLERHYVQPSGQDRHDLEHEIAHQWFGCAVGVDYDRGNWSEGFAIYVAEHRLQEEQGQGWQCRRRILSGFQNAMQRGREAPLRDFTERFDNPSRMVGYGKGAMVVHMLRRQVGEEAFSEALQLFFRTHLHAAASWRDVQEVFEKVSRQKLSWFFRQWVEDTGQPEIVLDRARLSRVGKGFGVEITLRQKGRPKRLLLPLEIAGSRGSRSFQVDFGGPAETFSFLLDFQPEEVIIDKNFEVFRKLAPAEHPPTLERLLAEPDLQLIPPATDRGRYREVIRMFTAYGARLRENPGARLPSTSLIILGEDPGQREPLPDVAEPLTCLASLRVRPHPQSPHRVAASFLAAAEVPAALLEEMLAFPFYSTYCLTPERTFSRMLWETPRGIRVRLPPP